MCARGGGGGGDSYEITRSLHTYTELFKVSLKYKSERGRSYTITERFGNIKLLFFLDILICTSTFRIVGV